MREHYPWLADTLIGPLVSGDQMHLLDGRTDLAPGLTALPTPGHTPGHQSLLVGDDLLLTGDVVQHETQLHDPEIGYAHDADPDLARATRRSLLSRDAVLGTAHLNEAFVRVPRG